MKKIVTVLLFAFSLSSFAGTGSTTDFMLSMGFGYSMGSCPSLSESPDQLRHTACKLGESLKKANVSKKQFDAIMTAAEANMPEYSSICGKK